MSATLANRHWDIQGTCATANGRHEGEGLIIKRTEEEKSIENM